MLDFVIRSLSPEKFTEAVEVVFGAGLAMGNHFPGEEAYWVGFFAVDQKYRGQGVGFALIQQLEKILKEKGSTELWVSSVIESKAYYERQGFIEVTSGLIHERPHSFLVKKLV